MKLENKSDLSISKKGKILFIQSINVFSFKEDLTRRRPIERAQDMKQGRLPYAGGTYDGSPFSSMKSKIHPLENLHTFGSVPIGLENLLDFNQLSQTIASLAF